MTRPRQPDRAKAPRKPSGAQFRKQRKERDEQARREERARRKSGQPDSVRPSAIGRAPEDELQRVAWANRAAALVLEEVAADRVIDSEKRWKTILECVRSIGMTAVRALYESRLRRLESRVYGTRTADDGLEDEIHDDEPSFIDGGKS